MECIQHFSHEHPLIFFQADDLDDPKPYRCCICGLPILSSPSYTCSVDANCNFFVHNPCTQLPRELYYVNHRDTLNLERPTLSSSHSYKCRNSDCKFELHPLVAKPVEIKSKHISHSSHPLVACCREIFSHCDGCGIEEVGFFFNCQECNFWIHQDCTILPSVVKLSTHPHPYILSYSLPFNLLKEPCSICHAPWRSSYHGAYFQAEVVDFVHVTCSKLKMENLPTEVMQEFILELPDEEGTFPSVVIRRSAERNPSTLKYHKHPLILDDCSTTSREAACDDLLCDVCVQPIHISSPFYRCQSDGCHFKAHDICANHLPTSIQLFYAAKLLKEVAPIQDSHPNINICYNSVFPCIFCFRPANGLVYGLSNEGRLWGFCDVECAFAPKMIKHASHRQHLLFQMIGAKISTPLSCCSGESFIFDVYMCIYCDFSIHIKCALLPKKTCHKFDEHPLELIMRHDHNEDNKQVLYCEVCEQEIELKLWYYGCRKCEQYFHIDCIPSVGHTSKVKFGKTHVNDQLHQHPLALTRMLTHERHETCGLCKKIIQGFAHDQMAFHCSQCDFWIHFSCASATATLGDYSKYIKGMGQELRELKKNNNHGFNAIIIDKVVFYQKYLYM